MEGEVEHRLMKKQEVELGFSSSHKQHPEWKEKHAVSPSRCAGRGGFDLALAVCLRHWSTHRLCKSTSTILSRKHV